MGIPAVFTRRRLRLYILLVANGLAQAGIAFATTLLMRVAFDRMLSLGAPRAPDLWIALGFVAVAVTHMALRSRSRVDAERIGQDYVYAIRMAMYDKLASLGPRTLQKRSRGTLMLRFIGDLNSVRRWVSLGLARSTVAGVTMVTALMFFSQVNLVLALGTTGILVIGIFLGALAGRGMRQAVQESRRRHARLAANVSEKIASMAVVQICGQLQRERRQITKQGRRLREAMVERARVSGRIEAVMQVNSALGIVSLLFFGAHEVALGRATPGTVVGTLAVFRFLVPFLRDFARLQEYWYGARHSLSKIGSFLAAPNEIREPVHATDLPKGPGKLEFRGAGLGRVLSDISAIAHPRARVAVVGPNGAGKSTFLSLAARLVEPDEGTILMDGRPLADYSLSSIHKHLGMVGPDLPLLRGTVERNLRYRSPSAPAEELERVISLCDLKDVLAKLPRGIRTRVSDAGLNLSLGERHRIGLARALLCQPSILLLDECEANLDPAGERLIARLLDCYSGTILMATHRLEYVRRADVIWHLANGRLVELGSPAQLLHGGGPTSRLFSSLPREASCA